jgi:hypothetical protein
MYRKAVVFAFVVTAGLVAIPVSASTIPEWVKGVAGWWAEDRISDQEFLNGIEFLIDSGAIKPKIVQEQEARIKQLEARLAELEKPPIRVDANKELREATQLWTSGSLSDQAYYNRIQDLVNRGLVGPWDMQQEPEKIPDADKKRSLAEYREMATLWLDGGFDDSFMIEYVATLYSIGLVSNPPGYSFGFDQGSIERQIAEEQRKIENEREQFLREFQQRIVVNAEGWLGGKISDEQYLRNLISMSGDFYRLDPQYRLPEGFQQGTIPKILADGERLKAHKEYLRWNLENNQPPERYRNLLADLFF